MRRIEVLTEELDLSQMDGGGEPRVSAVGHISHEQGQPDIAILSERADGTMVGYLFKFHPNDPVADIYRIRPSVILGLTEGGGILIKDNDTDDFPMQFIGSISPKYLPQTLRLGEGEGSSPIRFSIEKPTS